jgi:cytochrome subunit of sulfide dehydrogenase
MHASRLMLAVAVVAASTAVTAAASPEAPAGASSCSGCHAVRRGVDTAVPPLAGRPAADIIAQMQAFKTGKTAATVMDRIAKGFSDAEVAAIADWYGQQH